MFIGNTTDEDILNMAKKIMEENGLIWDDLTEEVSNLGLSYNGSILRAFTPATLGSIPTSPANLSIEEDGNPQVCKTLRIQFDSGSRLH